MRALGFLFAVGGVIALLVMSGVWRAADEQGDAMAQGGRGDAVTPVAVASATRIELSDMVEALGTARANESVVITTQVTEIVSRVAFDSGDVVETGQVLVELTDAEESAALEEARAALADAERERARFSDLRARGVASQAQLDALSSTVEQARSRVQALEARLSDLIVRAPFDGVIGLRNTSAGALVRPGDPIATLDDISTIKLDFTVPERFIGVLERGAPVRARSAAYDNEEFTGVVTNIDSRVDPVTRTVVVRAEIDNEAGRLLPGMLMLASLQRDLRTAIVTPELAVLRDGAQSFVYAVVDDGEGALSVVRRNVETGSRRDGFIEIVSGLNEGDLVVSEGVNRLRPGAPVRITTGPDGAYEPARGERRAAPTDAGAGR